MDPERDTVRAARLWDQGWRLRGHRFVAPPGFEPHREVRHERVEAINAQTVIAQRGVVCVRRRAAAAQMIRAGHSIGETARVLEISETTVSRIAGEEGLQSRPWERYRKGR